MRVLFTWLSCSPRLGTVLFSLVFLLVGCGSISAAPASPTTTSTPTLSEVRSVSTGASRTYLGAVSGTRALLGIVLNGTRVRAYVCDGTPSPLATLAEWFAGQVSAECTRLFLWPLMAGFRSLLSPPRSWLFFVLRLFLAHTQPR